MATSTSISPGKKRGPPASGLLMTTCCSVGVHGGGLSPYELQLELAPYPTPNTPKLKMPKNKMIPEMVPRIHTATLFTVFPPCCRHRRRPTHVSDAVRIRPASTGYTLFTEGCHASDAQSGRVRSIFIPAGGLCPGITVLV